MSSSKPVATPFLINVSLVLLAGVIIFLSINTATLVHSRLFGHEVKYLNNSISSDTQIEAALMEKSPPRFFVYNGDFPVPFRPYAMTNLPDQTRRMYMPVRKNLFLKGILTKEVPLAILEGDGGETFILKTGDSIAGGIVTAIADTCITIKDARGSYILRQKEH